MKIGSSRRTSQASDYVAFRSDIWEFSTSDAKYSFGLNKPHVTGI